LVSNGLFHMLLAGTLPSAEIMRLQMGS